MALATISQGLNSSHYAQKVSLISFFSKNIISKRLIWVVVAFDNQDLRKLPPPKCQFSCIIK